MRGPRNRITPPMTGGWRTTGGARGPRAIGPINFDGTAREQYEAQEPHQRLGDAPVEEQYHAQMTKLMQLMDEFLNGPKDRPGYEKRTGVVIMMFPFGDTTGRCNYMSNGADRRDIVTLMREMIARFEGQPEVEGRA